MEEDKGAGAEKTAMEDNTFETLERDFQEVGLSIMPAVINRLLLITEFSLKVLATVLVAISVSQCTCTINDSCNHR